LKTEGHLTILKAHSPQNPKHLYLIAFSITPTKAKSSDFQKKAEYNLETLDKILPTGVSSDMTSCLTDLISIHYKTN
jgi:hypothetical protein